MHSNLTPGTVCVCPWRDIECGSNWATWCAECPQWKTAVRATPPSPSTDPIAEDERAAFEQAWPQIHKHGIGNGWRGVALAAWQARAALSSRPAGEDELSAAAVELLEYLDDHDWGGIPEGATADRLRTAVVADLRAREVVPQAAQDIKTWRERLYIGYDEHDQQEAMEAEIADLRAQRIAHNRQDEKMADKTEQAKRPAGEVEELRALVKEWLCESCNMVYPGPPARGVACVICPKCGGPTGPRMLMENRKLRSALASRTAGEVELPPLPTLPRYLLDMIGEYGMARTDSVGQLEVQHRWEILIGGIKRYAADYACAALASKPAARDKETPCGS